jgi:putative lipase involved disintegration of autophagic bodies
MAKYFIDAIPLLPYSSERLVVVKGYTYDEVVDWFKNIFSTTEEKNLTKIREHFIWYNDSLNCFKNSQSAFDNAMDESSTVQGHYCSGKLANSPGCTFRLLVLKKELDFKNPYNVITVAHELLHLCQEFLPTFFNRDIEHEAEAYFHTYIMTKIIELYN